MADDSKTVAVNEHQGIGVAAIKKVMTAFKDARTDQRKTPDYSDVNKIADDVLELVEHVEADGLLDRVAQARKDMSEQTEAAERILPRED